VTRRAAIGAVERPFVEVGGAVEAQMPDALKTRADVQPRQPAEITGRSESVSGAQIGGRFTAAEAFGLDVDIDVHAGASSKAPEARRTKAPANLAVLMDRQFQRGTSGLVA